MRKNIYFLFSALILVSFISTSIAKTLVPKDQADENLVAQNLTEPIFSAQILQTKNLQSWLNQAFSESESLKAVDKNLKSLEAEIKSRDIALSGLFTFQAENFNNDQDAVTFARRSRSRFIDLIYEKPFATGSKLSLTSGHDRSKIDTFGIRNTADWEVRLTQSLWKDAFGRSTRYRHQGERAELLSRKANLIYERQLLILDLEGTYWDLSLALKEEQVRLKNIEISQRLRSWTKDRIRKSAAEKSDLLQAEALVSSGELDLVSVRNQIETLKNKIRQILPLKADQIILPELSELEVIRPVESLLVSQGSLETPKRLDTASSTYLAQQAEVEVKKVRESLKPDVSAYASYGQNGIAQSFDDAWNRAGDSRHSGIRFGVLIKVYLDRSITDEQEKAATLAAQADRLNADSLFRSVKLEWQDLNRRLDVLKNQVSEAHRLAQFQKQKVEEERRLYKLGRSTVFQLVTFEVEAAQAEIRKFQFMSNLRKLESQARLFTGSENIL